MSYFPLHESSSAFAWLCVFPFTYMTVCVFAVNQGVFAVHATFGPLHRGGSRQWNQEVLCLTQPPSSSSTHCRGIWQCKESSSHSAAALLQCRETRHAQNVPPLSHSGAAATFSLLIIYSRGGPSQSAAITKCT